MYILMIQYTLLYIKKLRGVAFLNHRGFLQEPNNKPGTEQEFAGFKRATDF